MQHSKRHPNLGASCNQILFWRLNYNKYGTLELEHFQTVKGGALTGFQDWSQSYAKTPPSGLGSKNFNIRPYQFKVLYADPLFARKVLIILFINVISGRGLLLCKCMEFVCS